MSAHLYPLLSSFISAPSFVPCATMSFRDELEVDPDRKGPKPPAEPPHKSTAAERLMRVANGESAWRQGATSA